MPERAGLLSDRNNMLELLWEIDAELRHWHATTAWSAGDTADQRVAIGEKMTQRHMLARELKEIGCAPWDFNPFRDNCWLVQPRKAS